MGRVSIRKLGALFLTAAFGFSAVIVLPANVAAQDEKAGQEKTKNSGDKNYGKTTQTNTAANGKSLSDKENPAMIGKRNINGGTDGFFGFLGGSRSHEMRIGRQLALEVEQQAKIVDDPVITEYINRVGQNIVLHSDAKIPFTIKVIDSDEVNAFALPGGYFFVNKGLILAADNESELAGVMAHEIAHVAARHAMENAGKGQFIGYGILAGLILSGPIGGAIIQNTAGLGQMLAFFQFSQGAEREADMLGVQYLYASGYDPTGMATMFEKLASQNRKKKSGFSKLFSTHPQSIERRDASLALVARFPERDEYVISTSEFQRVKDKLLKTTNAKVMVATDIDEGDTRPTLKRRSPETENAPTNGDDTPKTDAPPQLKRRGAEPDPKPTPDN